jgi:hypothetical protein
MIRRAQYIVVALVLWSPAACTLSDGAQPEHRDTLPRLSDTMVTAPRVVRRRPPPPPPPPSLSPLADSLEDEMVFAPKSEIWFTAAARGKRMVVDIGRVDADLRKNPALRDAFQEVVALRAPLRVGTRVRLFGPWGADDAVVSGYELWNGRIVATLEVPPLVDSLAKTVEPLPAAARLTGAPNDAVADSCQRDSIPEELAYRAGFVRDSIAQWLRDTSTPPFERLAGHITVRSSRINGCFGLGRVLVIVSLRAGNVEYVTERAAILDDSGQVSPLVEVHDYRFRAHDAVYALDADGDGIDDVATRAQTEGAGAVAILRLDTASRRMDRLTSGFAWEVR